MKKFYLKRYYNYNETDGNKNWLHINNCGYFFNIEKDITTVRATVRADYHLIYVSKGELQVHRQTLKSGDAYLFLPNEPHRYTYKQMEDCRYYWIHFTGNKVPQILSHCQVVSGVNKDNHRKKEKDTLFAMLTEELASFSVEPSDFAVSLFFSFLSLFKGEQTEKRRFEKAIKELQSTDNDLSISAIASSYNVSTSHFIRSFKGIYGLTPNEYRQNYRINQAMHLLETTDLSVNDIAEQCGFTDPFYFSRAFKRKTGLSPMKYRKQT